MDFELALILAFVFAGLGWVTWDVIAPFVRRDHE